MSAHAVLNRACVPILLASILLSGPAGATSLQLDKAPNLYTLAFGTGFAKSAVDGESLNVPGLLFSFDDVRWGGKWSFGVALGYLSESESGTNLLDEPVTRHYRSVPVYAVWRGYLGNPAGRAALWVGAGFGLGFNRLEQTAGNSYVATYGTSVAVTIPVGVMFALTDGLFLNASYGFHFLNESFFEDDIVHLASLGVVFSKF